MNPPNVFNDDNSILEMRMQTVDLILSFLGTAVARYSLGRAQKASLIQVDRYLTIRRLRFDRNTRSDSLPRSKDRTKHFENCSFAHDGEPIHRHCCCSSC